MLNLQAKLRGQKGASSLIALTFFLLCVMVGAVVLTAATVNAGHAADLRHEEQDRLTVLSAARLMQDAVKNGRLTVTVTTVDGAGSANVSTSCEITDLPADSLKYTLQQDAKEVFGAGSPAQRLLQLDAKAGGGGVFPQVKASLEMQDDYSLVLHFWMEQKGEAKNRVKLTIPTDVKENTRRSTREVSYDTGERDENGNPVMEQYTEITTVKTTAVTWLEGTAEKEA